MEIQVLDGYDDDGYRCQMMRHVATCFLVDLQRDLAETARWLPSPATITTRTVFLDDLQRYVKGEVSWTVGIRGYRDLQEISSLLHARKNHPSTVQRIESALHSIDDYRRMFANAA